MDLGSHFYRSLCNSVLPGGGGVYGSGTMMLIAVVAAVITGTAVAFLIIFVRKWFVHCDIVTVL